MKDEDEDESVPTEDWSDIDESEGPADRSKRPEPVVVTLVDDGAVVVDPGMVDALYEKNYFGKKDEATGGLLLYPEEIMIFAERNRLLALRDPSQAEALLPEIKEKWEAEGHDAFESDDRFLTTEELYRFFNEHVPDFWEKYVVYRDLKTRGYIVRRGVKDVSQFRVFKKGAKKGEDAAKFVYFGVFEGKPISLLKLNEISEFATNNRQELVLAVVDRQQDITYYNIKKQEL
jgi:tRNA-intron endonuclease